MDKVKNICPRCNSELFEYDVVDWRNDEDVCTIRANDFQQLESKIKANNLLNVGLYK